jgi:hypothetical protein
MAANEPSSRDIYAQYRRTHLTPSDVPSPFSFISHLYKAARRQLPLEVQDEIDDDRTEFLNIISTNDMVRSSGDVVSCMYV